MKRSSTTLILIFLFIIVGGIVLWWLFIDWAKEASDEGRQWGKYGQEYGRSNNASGCVQKALILNDECDGLTCGIHNKVFLSACLRSSQPEPEFCNGIPSSYSILEAAAWEVAQCEQIDSQEQACHQLFRAVHTHCTTRRGKGSGSR